jgi:hypothetical protein
MKVIFKFSKDLGNSKSGDEKEMFFSTAKALQTKEFGSITKKIVSVKQTANGITKKTEALSKEEKDKLKKEDKD